MLSDKMVATRRGTRVGSPSSRPEEETPEPTIRRTRRRTVIVTEPSQSEQTSDSQQDEAEEQNKVPTESTSPPKRETRRSKRQTTTANQTDCVHEADVSESESCCSVASDALVRSTTRSRRRTAGRERPKAAAGQEVSEEDTCSSASANKPRRSMRSQKKSASVPKESATLQDNDQSEVESCSSVASLSKVVETRMTTRSSRRKAVLLDDADPSEVDSCSSAMSRQQSTVRRSMRNRGIKPIKPIPIHLDESEAEASASSTSAKTKGRKVKSSKVDPVYDSEGCRSGPSTSPQRTSDGVIAADSDSESTCIYLDSPRSLRVKLTPCSSRTGSASSSHTVPSSRTRSQVKVTHNLSNMPPVVSVGEDLDSKEGELEKGQTENPIDTTSQSVSAAASDGEDHKEMAEGEMNKIVIVDDQECSILEDVKEDLTLTLDEEEDDIGCATEEAKVLAKESKQEISTVRDVSMSDTTENMEENNCTEEQTEAEKGVKLIEECEEIPEPAMESKPEFMEEAHGLESQASAMVKKTEKGVCVTEEDIPNVIEKYDTEDQIHSDTAETENSVMVVDESEEKVDAMEELVADDVTIEVENQKHLKLEEKGVSVTEEAGKSEAEKVLNAAEDVSVSPTINAAEDVSVIPTINAAEDVSLSPTINTAEDVSVSQTINAAEDVSLSQTISVIYSDATGQSFEDEQAMEVEEHGDIHAGHHVSEQQNKEDGSPVQAAEEGPSCSSNTETKSDKGMGGLLDSSEDEESDNEGLSDECCREDAEESESEAVCLTENQPGTSGEPDSAQNHDLFVIDARPGLQPSEKYYIEPSQKEEQSIDDSKAIEAEEDFLDEEGDDDDEDEDSKALFTTRKPAMTSLSSAIDPGLKVKELGGLYISFDGSKPKSVSNKLKKLKDKTNQDELLKNSIIVADFEKKDTVPPYQESKHAAKLKRKEERSKTTGDGWFNMKAPELTEEMKNDLKALKMRSAMDPKRFYKKNDREGFPKYFQVGTVVDNPADFYHSRIPKKERKKTIVEELLADAEFRSFNKRKYQEIMSERAAEAAGKMNKKHKFHKKK